MLPAATLINASVHLLFSSSVVGSRCIGRHQCPGTHSSKDQERMRKNKMSINEGADEIANRTSRRRLLRQIAGASLALPLAPWNALPAWASAPQPARRSKEPPPLPPSAFSPEDDQFLDELERSSFLFFWEQANPQTGLV